MMSISGYDMSISGNTMKISGYTCDEHLWDIYDKHLHIDDDLRISCYHDVHLWIFMTSISGNNY